MPYKILQFKKNKIKPMFQNNFMKFIEYQKKRKQQWVKHLQILLATITRQ